MARFALLASLLCAAAIASSALADPSPTRPTELEKRGPSVVHAAALMATSCSYCASCSSSGCSGCTGCS